MDIRTVCRLSGLTRGQVNQLISRHGMLPQGSAALGMGRTFTRADVFRFVVASRLIALGLSPHSFADALAWFDRIDSGSLEPEAFPGEAAFRRQGAEAVLLFLPSEDGLSADFSTLEGAINVIRARHADSAVILHAGEITEQIEREAKSDGST